MRKKTRWLLTVCAMCFVLCLAVFGIFAVQTLNMQIGGNIAFDAGGIEFEVSDGSFKTKSNATYTNISTSTEILKGFSMDSNTTVSKVQNQINSWQNLILNLDSRGDAILQFTITNKMKDSPLYVNLIATFDEEKTKNMDITVSAVDIEIPAGGTNSQTIELTFDILNESINAEISEFNVTVSLGKEAVVKTATKINAETGLPTNEFDYFYVEMGTFNGEPLRWRYVSEDGKTPYTSSTAPRSLKGMYILETNTWKDITTRKDGRPLSQVMFNNDYRAQLLGGADWDCRDNDNLEAAMNDYYFSEIRKYLNGISIQKDYYQTEPQIENGFTVKYYLPAGDSSNIFDDYSIAKDSGVYKIIKPRTMESLYQSITVGGESLDGVATYAPSLGVNMQQSDKFWLPSYQEVVSLNLSKDWGLEGKNYTSVGYWLRTPSLIDNRVNYATEWGQIGNSDTNYDSLYQARPCFMI